MTALTDLKAIALTANANKVGSAKGANLAALVAQAQLQITELVILLKQIVALHPSGGGDATNYAALNTILAELA